MSRGIPDNPNEPAREPFGSASAAVVRPDSDWLETLALASADTLQHDPGGTITPPLERRHTAEQRAMAVIEALVAGHPRLRLRSTLGEGGMGVVRAASQLTLDRTVAVKSLPPDRRTPDARLALLREAWITGSLEHPNVVPVHDIVVDDDGNPMIVLKRIEGVAWNTLMHDPEAIRERFDNDDPLAWNLDIFLSVCNAVRFAHSRGILHRDLKPENVMIGAFGEVYVLDWGIAVSLHGDESGVLPLARDCQGMVGTPSYMAPEMLGAGAVPLSERTDVYLLGGLLYEIMTGRPPHSGDSALALLQSVVLSRPELPSDAPEQLAEICRTAMRAEPDERIASADAMHATVLRFLRYRGSARLVQRAERDLRALLELLATPMAHEDRAGGAHRQELYRLFGACRFGFREALAIWSDNGAARVGLRRAIAAMSEHELAIGNPAAADALLAELDDPPDDLRARVDAARRSQERQDRRLAELEQLSADLDVTAEAGARDIVVICNALLFLLVPVGFELVYGAAALGYPLVVAITLGFAAVCAGLFGFAREALTHTAINRRAVAGILLLIVGQLATEVGLWLLGQPVQHALVFLMLLSALVSAMLISVIGVSIWPMVAGFGVAFLVSAWRVEWVLYCVSGANIVVLVTILTTRHRREQSASRAGDDAG